MAVALLAAAAGALAGAPAVAAAAGAGTAAPGGEVPHIVVAPQAPAPQRTGEGPEEGGDPLLSRRFSFERFRTRVESHWFKRKVLLSRNLQEEAGRELGEIRELSREIGVENLPALAVALVHEGDGFIREGNFSKARDSYLTALEFAPEMPQAHSGLAAASWKAGEGPVRVAAHQMRAISAAARENWISLRALANGLVVLLVTLLAASAIAAFVLMLRHQKAFRHDVQELLERRFSAGAARAGAWALLLLPALTVVLAPLTPAWWLAILCRYGETRERVVSLVLLGLLVVAGPLGRFTMTLSQLAADPTAQLLLQSAGGNQEPEGILALEELAASQPQDALYPSLLGDLYLRGRFLQEAMIQYRKAAELTPSDPRPPNNLGNIYFLIGRLAEASQQYRRSIEIDPHHLPAYVNLHLALQAMFDFRQAEEALRQGRSLNSQGIAELLEGRRRAGRTQEPIASEVSRGEIWRRVLARGSWEGSVGGTVRAGLFAPISLSGLLLFLAALVVPVLAGGRTAKSCLQCGRAFCSRCQTISDSPDVCVQCRQLILRRDGFNQAVRSAKLEEISRHGRRLSWTRRVLSLVLPGADRLYAGRPVAGILWVSGWVAAIGAILLSERLLVPPSPPAPGTTLLIPCLLVASGLWLAANLRLRAAA